MRMLEYHMVPIMWSMLFGLSEFHRTAKNSWSWSIPSSSLNVRCSIVIVPILTAISPRPHFHMILVLSEFRSWLSSLVPRMSQDNDHPWLTCLAPWSWRSNFSTGSPIQIGKRVHFDECLLSRASFFMTVFEYHILTLESTWKQFKLKWL